MEYLEGESLALPRAHRLSHWRFAHAVLLAVHTADALARHTACGIVHRDLKPDNVYLALNAEADGPFRVKLLDFGIAKLTVRIQTSAGASPAPAW
jgi:serine/threonine-protein kinase